MTDHEQQVLWRGVTPFIRGARPLIHHTAHGPLVYDATGMYQFMPHATLTMTMTTRNF